MKFIGTEKTLNIAMLTWEEMMIQKCQNEGGINIDVRTTPGKLWVTNPRTGNTTVFDLKDWYDGMVEEWITRDNLKFDCMERI